MIKYFLKIFNAQIYTIFLTMNAPIQDEESRKLHDEEELRRYNASKRKKKLKIYGLGILIVIMVIVWVIVGLYR